MPKTIHSIEHRLFLELLRDARVRTGMTQVQLAAKLGWPQASVSYSERGTRRLDVIELRAWMNALNSSPMELLQQLDERIAANSLPPQRQLRRDT